MTSFRVLVKLTSQKFRIFCKVTRNFAAEASALNVEPTQTIGEVKKKLHLLMGSEFRYSGQRKSWAELSHMEPKSQAELAPRSMKDSFDTAVIPLGTNVSLQNKYINPTGAIRLGRILEDIDIFAVWIVLKHIKNPKQVDGKPTPYAIVTGHVDKISVAEELASATSDIKMKGMVSWVGKSSCEVVIWLEQLRDGRWERVTKAYFLMVARNRNNTASLPINPLEPLGQEEMGQFKLALQRLERRKKEESVSLLKTVPDAAETNLIHDIFVKSIDPLDKTLNRRILPEGSVWLHDTKIVTHLFPQPEDRNTHNTIFGGFIMRMCLELAWMAGFLHTRARPNLILMSDVSFRRAINIGNLIKITSQVVFTEDRYMQVVSFCEVEDVPTGDRYTSNVMHYTLKSPVEARRVVPDSYQDAVSMIDGRRHFLNAMFDIRFGDKSEMK